METIRISFGRGKQGIDDVEVLQALEAQLTSASSLEWEMYRNPVVREDWLIVLRWKGDPPSALESNMAQVLVRELKRYGLVDHAVWSNS